MDGSAWAIVLATITGPIAAVLITRWRDKIADQHKRRLDVFRTLMSNRRGTATIAPEPVKALNMVEVEFHGHREVIDAWKVHIAHLNVVAHADPQQHAQWEERRLNLLAKLLFAMSRSLGYHMSELDIRNGGYAPDGWRYRDERLGAIQEFIVQLAKGTSTLPVEPMQRNPGGPNFTAPPTPGPGKR